MVVQGKCERLGNRYSARIQSVAFRATGIKSGVLNLLKPRVYAYSIIIALASMDAGSQ